MTADQQAEEVMQQMQMRIWLPQGMVMLLQKAFVNAIHAAIVVERESCAVIAQNVNDVYNIGSSIASDIRARSKKP